ncbi:hypothetical protein QBC38DRAFT_102518 [Podospora fimiseda]|uniref:Uncharacterized protein n=1 Tax=Podospora fimiseda TaxID=252190 RepID=A0AAN6YMZ1_9PEZI|nr:hypothetical protein QBC38DRAFT_102518 [Podospora fimiseda]
MVRTVGLIPRFPGVWSKQSLQNQTGKNKKKSSHPSLDPPSLRGCLCVCGVCLCGPCVAFFPSVGSAKITRMPILGSHPGIAKENLSLRQSQFVQPPTKGGAIHPSRNLTISARNLIAGGDWGCLLKVSIRNERMQLAGVLVTSRPPGHFLVKEEASLREDRSMVSSLFNQSGASMLVSGVAGGVRSGGLALVVDWWGAYRNFGGVAFPELGVDQ